MLHHDVEPIRRDGPPEAVMFVARSSAVRYRTDLSPAWLGQANSAGGELVGGDDAEPAGLVVLDGLEDLLAGVHHERAVVGDRCANRQPTQQQHVERLGLPAGGRHDEMVARVEDDQLAALDRAALGPAVPSPVST